MSIAAIIIASAHRRELLKGKVLPSVIAEGFDEVVVVGEYESGLGYRYFHVPDMTKTTIDALVKRDVGTLATTADIICYLSDDHAFEPFDPEWRAMLDEVYQMEPRGIGVPVRVARNGTEDVILNMGLDASDSNAPYCAGHAGFFPRSLIQYMPWTSMPHHRNWDLINTRLQLAAGALLVGLPFVTIRDLEPETKPWQ